MVLVLIDGLGNFASEYDAPGRYEVWDRLAWVAANGRAVGVHLVATADRVNSVGTALLSSFHARLGFRLGSEADYSALGMSIDAFDEYTPPGRAVWRGDEVQVAAMVRPDTGGAVAAPDAADAEEIDRASMALQAEAIAAFAGAASWEGRFKARPIQRLETRISLSELASYGAVAEGLVPIGISGDTLEPVGMRPSGLWVLCGPPGSGRSTCLWTMAAAVRTARPHGPSAYLGVAHSLAATSMTWSMRAFGEEAVAQAAATVGTDIEQGRFTGGLVVVEALDELLGDDAEDELGRLFKMAREAGVCVLVDGAIDKFNYGVPRLALASRQAIVLQPDADELEQITGLAVGRIDRARFPPGRAFLWADAGVSLIQVATPTEIP